MYPGCIGETAQRAATPPGPVASRPDERRRRHAIPVLPRLPSEDRGQRAALATTRGVRTVQPDDPIAAPPHLATRPDTPLRKGVSGLSFV